MRAARSGGWQAAHRLHVPCGVHGCVSQTARFGWLGFGLSCAWGYVTDVVSIDRTDEHFRLLYNVKGRFAVHRIKSQEAEVRELMPAPAAWRVCGGGVQRVGWLRLDF